MTEVLTMAAPRLERAAELRERMASLQAEREELYRRLEACRRGRIEDGIVGIRYRLDRLTEELRLAGELLAEELAR